MAPITGFFSSLFWGLLTLSVLVFIHEGGHFLAARACGVRVSEFFLGLPCRFRLAHTSRRMGTTFGITPFLLGGYAAICGMEETESPYAAQALGLIHRKGSIDVVELAEQLGCEPEEALDACAQLLGWGSVAGVYAEGENKAEYPSRYESVGRDAAGLTALDGRAFKRDQASQQGDCWEPPCSDEAFLEAERSHTYMGQGFFKRAAMLLAGIVVNVLCGVLLLVSVYSVVGFEAPRDVNIIGAVEAGSPAEQAGLKSGDEVLSVDGKATNTWTELAQTIHDEADHPLELVVRRDATNSTLTVTPSSEGTIGIQVSYEHSRLDFLTSLKVSFSYVGQTVAGIGQLIQPAHTKEVLDQSASIVGISAMASQAASNGLSSYLSFAALVSLSLGFMNLLPIPPLDGGKLLIEIIQALLRRRVPVRVQTWISYAGIAVFGLLFVYMLRVDLLRLL